MRNFLLILAVLGAALLAPFTPRLSGAVAASATAGPPARVIVKYKADSPLLRRQIQAATSAQADHAQALGQRVGIALRTGRAITARSHVVLASGMTSAQLAQRLAQESDVEYAVPDVRRHIMAAPVDPLAPSDPFYAAGPPIAGQTGGPASGQWYLKPQAGEVVSSIDIEPAWALTTGSSNIVVAVLDTGIRRDHADLTDPTTQKTNLLAGYDMVGPDLDTNGHSLGTYTVAGDNNGYDADPSDPGDFITAAEANQVGGSLYQCGLQDDSGNYIGEDSSWHGTQTAGLVGALTDNGVGMAGTGRNVSVLPVRVLGKCGGFDSDIQAGMLWAAGEAVSGVPTNPRPAKIVTMSLGAAGSCDDAGAAAYHDVINTLTAKGVTIVVSAGNDEGHAVSLPANCGGVIAVAGLRHVGTKVGFSSIGPQVSLSAPGGNCVNIDPGTACLYPILTTSNSGATTPVSNAAGGSIYTDSFNASFGTSFSAPLVAGTAALMLSVQPALTPAEVLAKLKGTVRPFPTTGGTTGIAQCQVPNASNPIDQDECYCTTGTCGAGMLDAGKAVAAAAGVQARISAGSASPTAGVALALSAAPSLPPVRGSITGYAWSIASSGGIVTSITGADTAAASVTPSGAGTFAVKLTATDSNGVSSSATSSISVAAAPSDGTGTGTGAAGAVDPTWLLLLLAAVLALFAAVPRRR